MTRLQPAAIAALLTEPSQHAAARKAGIDRGTLLKWLKTDEFRQAYQQAQKQLLDATVQNLANAATAAAETLVRNLGTGNRVTGDRLAEVQAALTILERVPAEDINPRRP
jgi:hypothetical protein